jgi:uroporphyrinogen decarboxylase
MNSRERVMAALNHQQPDKVAVDFGGHRSSGISAIAYAKLKKALGISGGDVYVYDIPQQLAIVEPEVLDVLKVDTVEMGRGFLLDEKDWKDWTLPDGTACKIPYYINFEKEGDDSFAFSKEGVKMAVQKKGCLYFEQCYYPMADRPFGADDFADVVATFPNNMWGGLPTAGGHLPFTEDGLKELASGAKALRQSTDRAIIGIFGGNLFEGPQFLYGMDKYFMYMGLYPDLCIKLSELLCDHYMGCLEKYLGAVGPYIDIILFGDDLGCQTGLLISPSMYREFYKPYHRRMWTRAKELADVKVLLHSCGGIEPLLGDFIEVGLDAVNPVQITCDGMDAGELKKRYGDHLTFWGGGCDTRDILPTKSPVDIQKHVKEQISIMNPGGGFVFQQVHNILANVEPENIIAMFKEVNCVF